MRTFFSLHRVTAMRVVAALMGLFFLIGTAPQAASPWGNVTLANYVGVHDLNLHRWSAALAGGPDLGAAVILFYLGLATPSGSSCSPVAGFDRGRLPWQRTSPSWAQPWPSSRYRSSWCCCSTRGPAICGRRPGPRASTGLCSGLGRLSPSCLWPMGSQR